VGHSFGGLVALAVALRNQVDLASLVVIEAPAVGVLRDNGELRHYHHFRDMTDAYFAAFNDGDLDQPAFNRNRLRAGKLIGSKGLEQLVCVP
jgi:pimeloyl-ACP methyl ester carboxylesterase